MQSIKTGSLFWRLAHERIAGLAGEKADFTIEEIEVLIDHSNDPDSYDWFLDRFWKHFYEVGIGFGGAPQSCEYKYKLAVNENNFIFLSHSSHYLMDVGCVFHTTIYGQGYHLWYERWIDENIEEIISMINIEEIQPIIIDEISPAVIELATKTNSRYYRIIEYLSQENYDMLKIETADNLKEVISYLWGLYLKFIQDINDGVQYEIRAEITPTKLMLIALFISVPIVAYHLFKPKPLKMKSHA